MRLTLYGNVRYTHRHASKKLWILRTIATRTQTTFGKDKNRLFAPGEWRLKTMTTCGKMIKSEVKEGQPEARDAKLKNYRHMKRMICKRAKDMSSCIE